MVRNGETLLRRILDSCLRSMLICVVQTAVVPYDRFGQVDAKNWASGHQEDVSTRGGSVIAFSDPIHTAALPSLLSRCCGATTIPFPKRCHREYDVSMRPPSGYRKANPTS